MNTKGNAGRPASIIELHLNNFDATIEKILGLNEKNRLRVLKLCSDIQNTLSSSSSIGTQTETKIYADISCQTLNLNTEQILENIIEGNLSDNDLEFLVSNIFPNLEDKILNIFCDICSSCLPLDAIVDVVFLECFNTLNDQKFLEMKIV